MHYFSSYCKLKLLHDHSNITVTVLLLQAWKKLLS